MKHNNFQNHSQYITFIVCNDFQKIKNRVDEESKEIILGQ